jgi:hypothetical protein
MKRILLLATSAGLALCAGKSYTVELYQPVVVGATELKPGEYRMDVAGEKAVLRRGKVQAEATVKEEDGDAKYGGTSVIFADKDGKRHIQEIRLGGTKTKLVFNE